MVVHNFVLEAGDELRVTCAGAAVNGNNAVSNNSQYGGKKGKNNTRKQDGGKKALSGFMKFAKAERPNIMKENPNIEFGAVGKELGKRWLAIDSFLYMKHITNNCNIFLFKSAPQ